MLSTNEPDFEGGSGNTRNVGSSQSGKTRINVPMIIIYNKYHAFFGRLL